MTTILYLLSFLLGVFIIWKLGRDELYDEDKLIDLSLICTVAALITARAGYFIWQPNEWASVVGVDNVGWSLVRLLQLNTGANWLVGLAIFFAAAAYLLWRWKWPQWPMLGIMGLGGAVAVMAKELLLWYWEGLSYQGLVLAGAVLTGAGLIFFLKLEGGEVVGRYWEILKRKLKIQNLKSEAQS